MMNGISSWTLPFKMLAAGTAVMLCLGGVMKVKKMVLSADFFAVKEVSVNGRIRSDESRLERFGRAYIGQNIFTAEADASQIAEDAWIDRVSVTKSLPDTLEITVFEKQPVFRYGLNGRCGMVTSDGERIAAPCADVNVTVYVWPDEGDFRNFARIAGQHEWLQKAPVRLYRSYFTTEKDGVTITGSYDPATFAGNLALFDSTLKERYAKIGSADLRAHGKIFVNGVLHGT